MAIYDGALTVVRTLNGDSNSFEVKDGLHQGPGISSESIAVHNSNGLMDVVSRDVRGGMPWELLYADYLALMAESESELKQKLLKWVSQMDAES